MVNEEFCRELIERIHSACEATKRAVASFSLSPSAERGLPL